MDDPRVLSALRALGADVERLPEIPAELAEYIRTLARIGLLPNRKEGGGAMEDEQAAAAESARLTAEDQERRRREEVDALLAEHEREFGASQRAGEEVIRAARRMDVIEEQLRACGETVKAQQIRERRPRWSWQVLRQLQPMESPLEPEDWKELAGEA